LVAQVWIPVRHQFGSVPLFERGAHKLTAAGPEEQGDRCSGSNPKIRTFGPAAIGLAATTLMDMGVGFTRRMDEPGVVVVEDAHV
jgi:hypothetical protein